MNGREEGGRRAAGPEGAAAHGGGNGEGSTDGRGARPEGEREILGERRRAAGCPARDTAGGPGVLGTARAGACEAASRHRGRRPSPPGPARARRRILRPPGRRSPASTGSEWKCPHFRREGRAAAEPMSTAKGADKGAPASG